jgi:hypothetical protein
MCHALLRDASFWRFLQLIDHDLAEQESAGRLSGVRRQMREQRRTLRHPMMQRLLRLLTNRSAKSRQLTNQQPRQPMQRFPHRFKSKRPQDLQPG